jgi:hypothetical protein
MKMKFTSWLLLFITLYTLPAFSKEDKKLSRDCFIAVGERKTDKDTSVVYTELIYKCPDSESRITIYCLGSYVMKLQECFDKKITRGELDAEIEQIMKSKKDEEERAATATCPRKPGCAGYEEWYRRSQYLRSTK